MRSDFSLIQIACTATLVSLNFCRFTKILRLELWLKFKVRGREIGRGAMQTFQTGLSRSVI